MRQTSHGDYLIQLTRLPHSFPVNAYLIREDDGFTLIDTALPKSSSPILDAARTLGLPIVRIVLTHAHGDHIGSLDDLHEALPQAEVLISERDARPLRRDLSVDPDEPQTKLHGSFPGAHTRPTISIAEGDRVGSLEAVASPGHTPGHFAFLDTRDRSLIAGDAFQTAGGVAVSGVMRPLFPFPSFATWNKPTALGSARRLRALNPVRLAVGHGPVLESPREKIEHAIQEATRKFR